MRTPIKLLVGILLAATLSACAPRPRPMVPGPARTDAASPTPEAAAAHPLSVDDQVREAVFRHQFGRNASGIKSRAPFYVLSVGEDADKDPSPALMARFADHRPPVAPRSHATISMEGVIHRKTGERGLEFHITGLKWISDTVVEVSGGYYEGSLSSSGNTYRVERKDGAWVVADDKMLWISDAP